MRTSTRIVNAALSACVVALVVLCTLSVCSPVRFQRERARRETIVKQRLNAIRVAQERYREATGVYAGTFDKLVGAGLLADSLQYVPYAKRLRFRIETNVQTATSGRKIPTMECGATYNDYLHGLDPTLIGNLNTEAQNEGRYPGLKIGDLTTPNKNDGNWE